MDVRMAVCERIVQDAVLRALLLNTPEPGRSRAGEGARACSLVLDWAGEDPTAVQWLTATVELPRSPSADRLYLDVVLQRLQCVVTAPGAPFTTRCVATSPLLADSRAGTVARVGTYEFAAVPRRAGAQLVPGRRERPPLATAFPGASPNLN
ncbi:hypothetical protein ACI79D_20795 [Geodermatophilus sp. SYSU D00708]